MKHLVAVYFAIIALAVPWFVFTYPDITKSIVSSIDGAINQVATVIISHNPKTAQSIKDRYDKKGIEKESKVRVLIVAGHEPDFGGTEFGTLKERDLTVELSDYLAKYIKSNSRFEVFTTRDSNGWTATFDKYFKEKWDDIKEWTIAYKREQAKFVSMGKIEKVQSPVFHNTAKENVALRLHGINKWINENDIDIAIHIHFNDYPRDRQDLAGEYTGFAVYVPEGQYFNSSTTKIIAERVFKRLAKYNPVSDLRMEKSGIVEDQDLIAVGSNNSLNSASMLIEYGYIYEPQFLNPETRDMALKDLAYQTYLGLIDFFDIEMANYNSLAYDTTILPYSWERPLEKSSPKDVYALQTAFIYDSIYPPKGYSKNDCPRSGKIGPCTKTAIQTFSERFSKNKNINETLNTRYGMKLVN